MPSQEQIQKFDAEFASAVEKIDNLNFMDLYETETGYKFRKKQSSCLLCGSGTSGKADSDGALYYYAKSNTCKCYACGESMGWVKLLKHQHNFDYKEAVLYASAKFLNRIIENPFEDAAVLSKKIKTVDSAVVGSRPKYSAEEEAEENAKKQRIFDWLKNQVLNADRQAANAYLHTRNIDTSKLPANAFYGAEPYKSNGAELPGGVVFLDSEGVLINKRYIGKTPNGVAKSINQGTLPNSVYDVCFDEKNQSVYVTEGVINALSLYMHELSVIALFGTTNELTDVDTFARYFNGKKVVLAYDTDTAGLRAAIRRAYWILYNLNAESVQIMLFPESADGKADDCNDLLKNGRLLEYCQNEFNYIPVDIQLAKAELIKCDIDYKYKPELKPKSYYSRPAVAEEKDGTVSVVYLEEKASIAKAYQGISANEMFLVDDNSNLGFVPVKQLVSISGSTAHIHNSTDEQQLFAKKLGENGYVLWRPDAKKPFKELLYFGTASKYMFGYAEMVKASQIKEVMEEFSEDGDGDGDDEKASAKGKQVAFKELFITFNLKDLINLYACGFFGIYLENGWLDFDLKKEMQDWSGNNVFIIQNRDTTKYFARAVALQHISLKTFELKDHATLSDYLADEKVGKFKRQLNTALPYEFWEYSKKAGYVLNLIHLRHLLVAQGYHTLVMEGASKGFLYVKLNGRIVEKFDAIDFPRIIKNHIDNYLVEIGENSKLRSKVQKATELNENNLQGLKQLRLDFRNSNKHYQNWFFSDGYMWEVSKSGIRRREQRQLSKFIWKDEVLPMPSTVSEAPFSIILTEEAKKAASINDVEPADRYDIIIHNPNNYFLQFLFLTACEFWEEYEALGHKVQKELFFDQFKGVLDERKIKDMKLHLISRLTWLGYIMQDYRGMDHQHGLGILDALDYEDKKKTSAGGGKSIIAAAIKRVKYTWILKADAEDFCENKHRYEGYSGERVIVLDDMHRNSRLGNMLTDFSLGIVVNPKHKAAVHLSLADSPKIIFTRNYIDDEEERVNRRVGRCFVFNYFHDNKSGLYRNKVTPRDVFGRELLTEDSPEDANSLIMLFAHMYVAYMQHGTIEPPIGNLQKFRQGSRIGEVLINWLDEYFIEPKNFGYVNKKNLQTAFMTENRMMSGFMLNKYNSPKRFKELVQMYCELRAYIFNPEHTITDKERKRILRPDTDGKTAEFFYIMPTETDETTKAVIEETAKQAKDEYEQTIFPLETNDIPF